MKYWFPASCLMLSIPLASALPSSPQPTAYTTVYPEPSFSLFLQGRKPLQKEGKATGIIPIYFQNNALLYGTVQGQYADSKDWRLSVGVGSRYLLNTHQLVGGYLCLDRLTSSRQHVFWLLSPGIELFTQFKGDGAILGLTMNTYLPISTTRYPMGNIKGDEVTDPYYRNQINPLFSYLQIETIRFGVDAHLSYHFPGFKYASAALSSYFFNHIHQPFYGIEAGIDFHLNQYLSASIKGTINNTHSGIIIGLRLSLGKSSSATSEKHTIDSYLSASMPRYIAPLSNMTSIMLEEQAGDYLAVHKARIQQLQEDLSREIQQLQALTAQKAQLEEQITASNDKIRVQSDTITQRFEQIETQRQNIAAREDQIRTTLQPLNQQLIELTTHIENTKLQIAELKNQSIVLQRHLEFYTDVGKVPALVTVNLSTPQAARDKNIVDFRGYRNRLQGSEMPTEEARTERENVFKSLITDQPNRPLHQLLISNADSTFLAGVNTNNPFQPIRTNRIQALATIYQDETKKQLDTVRLNETALKNELMMLEPLKQNLELVQQLTGSPTP